MKERGIEKYEAELRAARPARAPDEFMARLRAARPDVASTAEIPQREANWHWPNLWRWLGPSLAFATVLVGLIAVQANHSPAPSTGISHASKGTGLRKAELKTEVQMNEELVSSFDLVATLPGGAPVRFHYREWLDQVTVRDKTNGVEIEKDVPRMELVPVRYETY